MLEFCFYFYVVLLHCIWLLHVCHLPLCWNTHPLFFPFSFPFLKLMPVGCLAGQDTRKSLLLVASPALVPAHLPLDQIFGMLDILRLLVVPLVSSRLLPWTVHTCGGALWFAYDLGLFTHDLKKLLQTATSGPKSCGLKWALGGFSWLDYQMLPTSALTVFTQTYYNVFLYSWYLTLWAFIDVCPCLIVSRIF